MSHAIPPFQDRDMRKPPDCKCPWCQASYHKDMMEWHLNRALEDAENDNVDLFYAKEKIKDLEKAGPKRPRKEVKK